MKMYRFTVKNKMLSDSVDAVCIDSTKENRKLLSLAKNAGFTEVISIEDFPTYFIYGELSEKDVALFRDVLLCDNALECCEEGTSCLQFSDTSSLVETCTKQSVADSTATEVLKVARGMGINIEDFVTGHSYVIKGELATERVKELAEKVLCNPINEVYSIGFMEPLTAKEKGKIEVARFDVMNMKDGELEELSRKRRLSLDLTEMRSIRSYFEAEARACTDAELEMIAQSWSEHCVHKTFKADIRLDDSVPAEMREAYPETVRGILKTYIKKATDELPKPWLVSTFVDNAGIIEFDDETDVSFKVETHNHPSSLEPFGGANTGVGGVIRDIMGVSAKPIATTDVLCFAPPDTDVSELPKGTIPPSQIIEGVVAGVKDYGNKMGIPTVNGSIHYHSLYATNPLVYCGCVGSSPKGKHKREQKEGDRIVSLGKRVGRDGIGGATFSSMVMGEMLENPPVQKGEPIIEKKVLDVLLVARDEGLYSAITDCGAGGFSSSIGEMASSLGCEVELKNVKTQYDGLQPYELWISETQERMVIAVPPCNMERLLHLCEAYDVEAADLGYFTGRGRIEVKYSGESVIDLSCDFLENALPTKNLLAVYQKRSMAKKQYEEPTVQDALKAIVDKDGLQGKEDIVRLYDYEVQGGTILAPFMGESGHVPQDAAVIKPIGTASSFAIALSNSLHERHAMIDPYKATALTIDEAVRKLVCVGCDPSRIALLDNFCLGSSNDASVIFDLLEMARSCYETAKLFATPFISGKDSFNNEYKNANGSSRAIPPSLLISAIGRVEDDSLVVSSVLKKEGSALYLIGHPHFSFEGSLFESLFGSPYNDGVPFVPPDTPLVYSAFYECIKKHLISSSHCVGKGGLLKTLHDMSLDGNLTYKLVDNIEREFSVTSNLQVYFAECAGCMIVEIEKGNIEEFECSMVKDYRRFIGHVVKS